MLINTFLDTEDFVHLYYTDDEPSAAQGCSAGARMASKYPRPPSPDYADVPVPCKSEMTERERHRAPPPEPPPPQRARAADTYPRQRTHYDEPGVDVAFTPICGEFVQWVSRTADGGTVAMSNYRIHVQPRRRTGPGTSIPLRLIDAVETSELQLTILCKNGRTLKCAFSTGDQCAEWNRRLTSALTPLLLLKDTFAAAYAAWAKEQPPASAHRALMRVSHTDQKSWFGPEVERLGFTAKGQWRITMANAEYKLCSSYPPLLVVPASIADEELESVARFRALRRIPAVVWRHRGNGAIIARSSQPEVGWFGWRNGEDERLLTAYVTSCTSDRGLSPPSNKQIKLLIIDARSYASAVTNRARGGGVECAQYYLAADIQFMAMPNIHHVRRSFQAMRQLCAEPSDAANWHSNLERTLWLQYVSGVCRAGALAARSVASGRPVLVHCSDGWDRTPQIVAAAQIILDPYYRTTQGFRVLIEREWLDFGHKFADRCGHQFGPEDPNERSPIFLQWLDVVHQFMLQYPCSFEFNDAYLIKLATHVHSCMFGTFLCNTRRERAESRALDTAQVWQLLAAPAYRNHLYTPNTEQVLWPEYGVRYMRVWTSMFCSREELDDDHVDMPPVIRPPIQHHNGMTRTRSCDNLINESERRVTQRRCSDPSIAPDVMKLQPVVVSEQENRGGALTDSCVDQLAGAQGAPGPLAATANQVDNLHPDHFENACCLPRDIASGSSSVERELSAVKPSDSPDKSVDVVDGPSDSTSEGEMTESVIRIETSPEVETPEEPPVFVCDAYGDGFGITEVVRESARTRNISITWRSISESSNQSSTGFDIAENPNNRNDNVPQVNSHESSPIEENNHNSTEGDVANHNVVNELTNHNRNGNAVNGTTNGVNGIDKMAAKFLEVDLNGGATSSSISSESEGEAAGSAWRHSARGRVPSQATLCPSPRRRHDHGHTSGIETSGSSGSSSVGAAGGAACWCGTCGGGGGGGGGALARRCPCGAPGVVTSPGAAPPPPPPDALDGLPPAQDPTQQRLHQIILYQKKVVDELSGQLREAREALRRAGAAFPAPPAPHSPSPTQVLAGIGIGSSGGGGGAVNGRSGSSSSGSEVEVGEEARGVVWLPDSAAQRCQHCSNHFWLARRRHHCRRCGGIFCGSCSEMSSWGDCGSVRMCRRCRALR